MPPEIPVKPKAEIDIVGLGEPLYELNQQPDGRFLAGFGGDTSNAIIAAARLGARTAYVSRLGDDMFGHALAGLWQREGVDASTMEFDPDAPTGLYFVTHSDKGHAFHYRRKGSAASLMTPADVPVELLKGSRFLHVSGISLAISASAEETVRFAVQVMKSSGGLVSFDTNFRPRLWPAERARQSIDRLASKSDILKTSIEDSEALLGVSDPEIIARHYVGLGSKIVLVTMGAAGVLAMRREERLRIPAFNLASVDATGAGDAFTGALLAELCRGEAFREAVRFANAAAALSTLGYGAIEPLPTRAAVENFLRNKTPAF